jgi:hypothetical protein
VYEGEVTELSPVETENPVGGFSKTVSHVVIGKLATIFIWIRILPYKVHMLDFYQHSLVFVLAFHFEPFEVISDKSFKKDNYVPVPSL